MTTYPPGARVTYADANATVSDGVPGLVVGTINGPPVEDAAGDVYVPVFSQRDNGREATTVYVHAANIVWVGS